MRCSARARICCGTYGDVWCMVARWPAALPVPLPTTNPIRKHGIPPHAPPFPSYSETWLRASGHCRRGREKQRKKGRWRRRRNGFQSSMAGGETVHFWTCLWESSFLLSSTRVFPVLVRRTFLRYARSARSTLAIAIGTCAPSHVFSPCGHLSSSQSPDKVFQVYRLGLHFKPLPQLVNN